MPEQLVPRALSFLSFVIPVYNEEATLPFLRSQFETWLPRFGERQYEIVLVDDGSRDASLVFCADWARDCPFVKVISFSRNFGHQSALSCGLSYATGEAVVILDADLQDPLSAVPAMIERFEQGYDVAYGQRIRREGETIFKKVTAWAFYRIMKRCVYKDLPNDTGDFRLVSRRVVDIVNAMPEDHLFFRGIFAWVGFPQVAVPYVREERRYGETKYPLSRMAKFAWQAITSFSALPIRLVSLWGACVGFLGFLICLYAFCSWLMGNVVQGWTSLIGVTALLGGTSIMAIGIVGEYVGNIFEEVKKRPKYIVSQVYNIPGGGIKAEKQR